jgi:arginyl-tRNA synthetase
VNFPHIRVASERADRVLYVTDAGQASHFDQVFQVVRRGEFVPPNVELK